MTISHDPPSKSARPRAARAGMAYWRLQDAKARFSELVRRVRSEGPQRVTVHGRDAVVVVAAEDYERLQGAPTGAALVSALQAGPKDDLELPAAAYRPAVRAVEL